MTDHVFIARCPSVGSALENLLATRFHLKGWARRSDAACELPPRLERCVAGLSHGCEWRAFGDDRDIFFAIARAHEGGLSSDVAISLEVFFLDAEAAVYAAGVWEHDVMHGWWLDALVDLSYDCDDGWWSDRFNQPKRSPEPRILGITPPTEEDRERGRDTR